MEKFKILSKNNINELPTTTGVYCFIENSDPIYIGKAIHIRERVKNHFQGKNWWEKTLLRQDGSSSLAGNSRVPKGFGGQVGFINTDSEIEALILEANLIKKYQPKFNVVWKDDKNYFYVAITKDEHPVVFITHQKNSIKTHYIGPFIEGAPLKKILKYLRRVFPFYTSARHPKNTCTWCHLELCPGPNPNLPEYKKNLKKLTLILQGKRKNVVHALRREMESFSRLGKFEEAGKIRDKMLALERILEHSHVIESGTIQIEQWLKTETILKEILGVKTQISRIECYDISNIQGKYAVGSMVVFVDGAPDKSQYKKFRIRMKQEPNDIAMLKEMLTRRLSHPEWGYPEVMLIDGGIAQLNVAIKVKNEILLNTTAVKIRRNIKNIKVISIAKGKRELLIENQKEHIPLKNLPQDIYNLIVHLDDEAHRFAITYHKKLRKKGFGIDIIYKS